MAINTLVFGFGHRARSGKDTAVAEIIARRKNMYDVRRYAFADVLKQEVTQAVLSAGGMRNLFLDGYYFVTERSDFVTLPEWVKYDENAPMDDPMCPFGKQRTLLQWWGTEFRRNVNPQYWVTRLSEKLEKEQPEIALITDMRFYNEMDFVKQYGETIRVDRAELPPLSNASHPSEIELSKVPDEDWTRILPNNGTLEEFKERAVAAFDAIMECEPESVFPNGYGLV